MTVSRMSVARRPKPRQRRPFARVVKYHLNPLADLHALGITVDDVGHHPWAFVQLDVGQHVHARFLVRGQVGLPAAVDRIAVHGPTARSGNPADPCRSARWTEWPRIPDHVLA